MRDFQYRRVLCLEEAFELASEFGRHALFMAGGTDVLVKIKRGALKPRLVVDLKGIAEMTAISVSNDRISIGALTTLRTLETLPAVRQKCPLLADAAGRVGSVQVRNRATLGGNLCNASPSADTAPALLALDAQASLCGPTGTRVVALSDFFSGPGSTTLGQGEVLTSLHIPSRRGPQGGAYRKLGPRKAMDIALVGVAVALVLDGEKRIRTARVALGAVAPTPIRAEAAERVLEGEVFSPALAREAGALAARASRPITDLRASAEYRREMVDRLCQTALSDAYATALSRKEGEEA